MSSLVARCPKCGHNYIHQVEQCSVCLIATELWVVQGRDLQKVDDLRVREAKEPYVDPDPDPSD